MAQGTLVLKEQTPTEVTYWVVLNGEKIGRFTAKALNSASGEALEIKVVYYKDEY